MPAGCVWGGVIDERGPTAPLLLSRDGHASGLQLRIRGTGAVKPSAPPPHPGDSASVDVPHTRAGCRRGRRPGLPRALVPCPCIPPSGRGAGCWSATWTGARGGRLLRGLLWPSARAFASRPADVVPHALADTALFCFRDTAGVDRCWHGPQGAGAEVNFFSRFWDTSFRASLSVTT